jgi:hypothetical protein
MCTSLPTHTFSALSFTNIKIQICTSLSCKNLIFPLLPNTQFVPTLWFFCLFPYKSIQIQICTSRQTHDFSAFSRFEIMGKQMRTSWQTHIFSAFSLTNIRIQIGTLCQSHDFSSSFYITQYKFKSVLRTKPMIFLLISFIE